MRRQNRSILRLLPLVALLALLTTSCASKMSAVNDLEKLSYDLRDHSSEYSVAQWKSQAERFVKIRKRIEKYDYTVAERQRIGKLEGDCLRYVAKGAKEGVVDKLLGYGSELQEVLDAISGRKSDK